METYPKLHFKTLQYVLKWLHLEYSNRFLGTGKTYFERRAKIYSSSKLETHIIAETIDQ
jgi:hypothetical protein